MDTISGILSALVTPFDSQDRINVATLRDLIQFQLGVGINGFYVTGGTGEGLLLDLDERCQVLDVALEEVGGQVPVIAHVGAISTRLAVAHAAYAARAGATAVASIPPIYFATDLMGLKAYYRAIAEAAGDCPVWVYYIPHATGVTMSPAIFAELMEIDNVVGVKYTAHNLYEMRAIIERAAGRDFTVVSGPDEMCLPALVMGAQGAVGTTYNVMPGQFLALYRAFTTGDLATAQRLQYEANQVIEALLTVPTLAGVKEILYHMGFDCGVPRGPQRGLTEDERQRLWQNLMQSPFERIIDKPLAEPVRLPDGRK